MSVVIFGAVKFWTIVRLQSAPGVLRGYHHQPYQAIDILISALTKAMPLRQPL